MVKTKRMFSFIDPTNGLMSGEMNNGIYISKRSGIPAFIPVSYINFGLPGFPLRTRLRKGLTGNRPDSPGMLLMKESEMSFLLKPRLSFTMLTMLPSERDISLAQKF